MLKIFFSALIVLIFYSCKSDVDGFSRQPNFVVILADDLGYADTKNFDTPNIDNLFNKGFELTNFHSSSVCTPTRVSLLTGKYPQEFGTEFERALTYNNDPDLGLPGTVQNIFKELGNIGYVNGIVGKWHLGWEEKYSPMNHGFDYWVGCKEGEIDYVSRVTRYGIYDWYYNGSILREDGYVTDLIAKHAIEFINSNTINPFCLYLPFTAPHLPFQGPSDSADRFEGGQNQIDWTKEGSVIDQDRAYKEMIESLDKAIGNIFQSLKEEGLLSNTLIIFMSDNGAVNKDFASNSPYRGFKAELFEGGTRVPCMFYWDGTIKAGQSNELTHTLDITQTIAQLANLGFEGDGIDLSDLILNNAPLEDRCIFNRRISFQNEKQLSITCKDWKMIIDSDQEEYLFQIKNDAEESNNLFTQFPDTATVLKSKILQWESNF